MYIFCIYVTTLRFFKMFDYAAACLKLFTDRKYTSWQVSSLTGKPFNFLSI